MKTTQHTTWLRTNWQAELEGGSLFIYPPTGGVPGEWKNARDMLSGLLVTQYGFTRSHYTLHYGG